MGIYVEITHRRDKNNNRVVEVPLSNYNQPATLFEEDWERLYHAGVSSEWKRFLGAVYLKGAKQISIGRLIANAGPGERVQYLDNNPLNLKRDNLVIHEGRAKYRTLDKIRPERRPNIQIRHKVIPPSWAT